MRKREREIIERALNNLNSALIKSSCVSELSPCHRDLVTARGLINKVLKEDEREKARLSLKGRRVVNK